VNGGDRGWGSGSGGEETPHPRPFSPDGRRENGTVWGEVGRRENGTVWGEVDAWGELRFEYEYC
jgi:hypothetical protein